MRRDRDTLRSHFTPPLLSVLALIYFYMKAGTYPNILQFAPVDVISVEDCQDDWSEVSELQICIRDDSGQHGACFVREHYLMAELVAIKLYL